MEGGGAPAGEEAPSAEAPSAEASSSSDRFVASQPAGQEEEEEEAAAAPGPAAAAPGACLQRLHILPFAEAAARLGDRSRIEFIAPELRRRRDGQEVLRRGDLIRHEGCEFAVIKCEPDEGMLHPDTDYFVDGEPLVDFKKIQFTAWGPDEEMTSEALFSNFIVDHFKGEYAPHGNPESTRVRLFYCNQMFQIGNTCFQVEATEPAGLGVVSTQTEIFATWDQTPEFDKVHIVPFYDTLPRAYDFDIFGDYLRPYLKRYEWKKFSRDELFTWQGVQFKVVAVDPADATARIGKSTTIYPRATLAALGGLSLRAHGTQQHRENLEVSELEVRGDELRGGVTKHEPDAASYEGGDAQHELDAVGYNLGRPATESGVARHEPDAIGYEERVQQAVARVGLQWQRQWQQAVAPAIYTRCSYDVDWRVLQGHMKQVQRAIANLAETELIGRSMPIRRYQMA
ncbi:unnamed protein product [Prorocentrum cordatum]|uniref:Uncharacterized protein n=1 Tax=Prorocentrum cordatum TaxID=2364126 RepID=A0ABN9UI10_9DINO|nr:unnamed protein product [Polarella glacialis]